MDLKTSDIVIFRHLLVHFGQISDEKVGQLKFTPVKHEINYTETSSYVEMIVLPSPQGFTD